MSLIGNILPLSHIVLDLEVSSKKRLFEEAGLLLESESGLSRTAVFECLFAREKLGTTALGHGVAIPHGRYAEVQAATGAFIRLKEAVDFDAPDGEPVSLVFVLLVPENASGEHLEVLSALAIKLSDKAVREQLLAAENAEAAHRILTA
ncbi:PTS IIA-like nitrogen-regulatory protein PtsN [Eikenella sp. NML03-A-027]|uniref:PTS IIA-like nitrogen regulatory protein PtsN n=1 Tax=Eikenella sp. NML03-A-027 TaxID=1795828 RepID=UPI0007E00109|nr:PTS IIA-like nitrogen regulatory protein PtsN [Eikenella sp. NML03-A-027]OAM30441.1 PTS IIA-like nitrogen-regulatory protein PtsN [Eikenella sp. NML03-A-027]